MAYCAAHEAEYPNIIKSLDDSCQEYGCTDSVETRIITENMYNNIGDDANELSGQIELADFFAGIIVNDKHLTKEFLKTAADYFYGEYYDEDNGLPYLNPNTGRPCSRAEFDALPHLPYVVEQCRDSLTIVGDEVIF